MKRNHGLFPVHDYSPALRGALSWLGDRHLLAAPAPRLQPAAAPYFAESRRWHPSPVANTSRKIRR